MADMITTNFSVNEMSCRCGCGLYEMNEEFMRLLQIQGVNGLYDMGANVWEWAFIGQGPQQGTMGGSWCYGHGRWKRIMVNQTKRYGGSLHRISMH